MLPQGLYFPISSKGCFNAGFSNKKDMLFYKHSCQNISECLKLFITASSGMFLQYLLITNKSFKLMYKTQLFE